jgi:hypothetical protein
VTRKSPGTSFTKKIGPVTYGKGSKTILSSSPTFADPADDHPRHAAAGTNMAPSNEVTWGLEGTMRDNYAHHEPAMFPEPSSTVPNATQTQQRVLDAVNVPAMLGLNSEIDTPHYQPAFDSIPCSDILKFTPAEAGEHTESSAREQTAPGLQSATPSRTSKKDPDLFASQGSRPNSSVHPKDSPLGNKVLRPGGDTKEQRALPFEVTLSAVPEAHPTASAKSPYNQKGGPTKTPHQRKSQTDAIPMSDDDLTAIGLSKEQYKPRPSRSRSLKVDEKQPIDYSVRPEKANKVSKRRRTTSAVGDTETITTPQKIRQICDMGFTPSSTKMALKQNNGDVTQTVDWLVSNGGDDELAPQDTPKTKTMSKENNKNSMMDPEILQNVMRNLEEYRRDDVEAQQNDIQTTATNSTANLPEIANNAPKSLVTDMCSDATPITSPAKVEVVIHKRTPKPTSVEAPGPLDTSSKQLKRRKTALDTPESELAIETHAVPEVAPTKKRGRGRPKKAATNATSTEPAQEAPELSNEPHADGILEIIKPNVVSEKSRATSEGIAGPSKAVHSAEPENCETVPTPAPPAKGKPQSTDSQTPERSTKPASDSPLNKGKVPYRVGLSKRARIAPLLRTLKK